MIYFKKEPLFAIRVRGENNILSFEGQLLIFSSKERARRRMSLVQVQVNSIKIEYETVEVNVSIEDRDGST